MKTYIITYLVNILCTTRYLCFEWTKQKSQNGFRSRNSVDGQDHMLLLAEKTIPNCSVGRTNSAPKLSSMYHLHCAVPLDTARSATFLHVLDGLGKSVQQPVPEKLRTLKYSRQCPLPRAPQTKLPRDSDCYFGIFNCVAIEAVSRTLIDAIARVREIFVA